jgi:arachidonate 5-lipoxygenase
MGNASPVNPTASYSGIIDAPVSQVWEAIRPWDGWIKWWAIYDTMEIIGDGKDEVGAIRKFKTLTENRTYQEKLVDRDDDQHVLRYELVSMEPNIPIVASIITTLTLQSVNDDQSTKVTWSSWTQGSEDKDHKEAATGLDKITAIQAKTYENGVKAVGEYLSKMKLLQTAVQSLSDKVIALKKALYVGQGKTWTYDDYPESAGPMPRMVKGIPPTEMLSPQAIGKMTERIFDLIYYQAAHEMAKQDPNPLVENATAVMTMTQLQGNADLLAVSKYVSQHWADDVEFCQQLLQGVNPLSITTATSKDQIPTAMQDLKGQGKSIDELISEKRLFVLDYKQLRNLKNHETMYFYAPVMLVYKEILEDKTSRLNILGIQLDITSKTVYTPQMEHKNRYQLAKLFVASADHQIHEFIYHLGIAHLAIEPIIVAVHNGLPEGNPIRTLLEPHFKETIGINYLARQTLVAKEHAFTDQTFAIGTVQALQIVSNAWTEYDFFKFSFPEQLKARGFDEKHSDGLENYFYRDDGFLLWNAIGDYTLDVVQHLYKEDQAVEHDATIQQWAYEMKNNAKVPGFPAKLATLKELANVLQIIIWNASALHSAVNYPQWSYLSFIPNRPNALYKPMPEDDGHDITPEYLQLALPGLDPAKFQITFSWLLSMPSDVNLTDANALKEIYPEGDQKFKNSLAEVSQKIDARNQALKQSGKAPYIFLLPRNVANSVNI